MSAVDPCWRLGDEVVIVWAIGNSGRRIRKMQSLTKNVEALGSKKLRLVPS